MAFFIFLLCDNSAAELLACWFSVLIAGAGLLKLEKPNFVLDVLSVNCEVWQ